MSNFDKCLDKFETKLRQCDDNTGLLHSRIEDLTERLEREAESHQKDKQLTEAETQKCQQLTDRLAKTEFELRVDFEKKNIEVNEEKQLNSSQIERMTDQINRLKLELSSLQTKNWHFEQLIAQKDAQMKSDLTLKSRVGPELTQLEKRADSFDTGLKSLTQIQSQLKTMVDSAIDLNHQLRTQLNERNDAIISSEKDISSLKTLVSEMKQKCMRFEESIAEKESYSLSLTNQNDLLKEEINELRRLLTNAINENKALIRKCSQNDMNSNHSVEQCLNNQTIYQSTDKTEELVSKDAEPVN